MMSEAREVLDRLTVAVVAKDAQVIAECYAENAVVVTPDEGELMGRVTHAQYDPAQVNEDDLQAAGDAVVEAIKSLPGFISHQVP
jgi:hypothetical protein